MSCFGKCGTGGRQDGDRVCEAVIVAASTAGKQTRGFVAAQSQSRRAQRVGDALGPGAVTRRAYRQQGMAPPQQKAPATQQAPAANAAVEPETSNAAETSLM